MARPWEKRAQRRKRLHVLLSLSVALAIAGVVAWAWLWQQEPPPQEEERAEEEFTFFIQAISYPDWFTSSVLNLPEDLATAKADGKVGIALYFAREDCPCCEVMKEVNLEQPDIIAYISQYFNVIAIDTLGTMQVTDFDGEQYNETRFSSLKGTAATPSMLFFDLDGNELFQLRGYHDSYEFRTVLDYILGHKPNETFEQYQGFLYNSEFFDTYFELHDNKIFLPPPYLLDRSKVASEHPLVVFFERGYCPACDFMHAQLMNQVNVVKPLEEMDVVQLDITSKTPVLTPNGEQTNSMEWAQTLGIEYTPSVIFFDKQGNLLRRVDTIGGIRQLASVISEVQQHVSYTQNRP